LLQGGPTDFSGIFEGEVKLFIGQSPSVKMGTIGITDENTFLGFYGGSPPYPQAGIAYVGLSGPTAPPSSQGQGSTSSISGTLTLTKVGSEWAGHFTATMVGADGGQLSGTFDTTSTCP